MVPAIEAEEMSSYRLPTNIRPVIYKIQLTPNLENFTYTGKQSIVVKVINPTKTVILNSVDLIIKNVTFKIENEYHKCFKDVVYNVMEEIIVIDFDREIPISENGILEIEFEGKINDKINGFYRSKYTSHGEIKFAAVTQFAPTDARKCFPCWDEPAVKAKFDITLVISKDLIAVSNMPVTSNTSSDGDSKIISFERTPTMSTYLVAFIICDYDFIENYNNNTNIKVYAPKDRVKQGQFSLEVATKSLEFFESYFNIVYPLSKLDLVTVADFSFGAMENWGMITYREAVLLIDNHNSSIFNKQKVALTVAHEVAHQWFGNLVTMEWWTHLWLNEGYASFMEYLSINELYPHYEIWAQFLIHRYIAALELDALANTHPIEVPIQNPSEITEIFDDISYNKGASVIRMIHNYIGHQDFQKGMNLYLNKYSYSNVQTENLWNALEEASKKQIGKIMSTWTKFPGFPLITIIEKESISENSRVFTFSQERFYANGTPSKNSTTWVIPITMSHALNPKQVFQVVILDEKSKDVEVKNISKRTWIKVNSGTVGFFRTLYSKDLLDTLVPAIQNQSLPAFDRFGILDDLAATVQAGKVSTIEFLKLIEKLNKEDSYIVWSCIMNNLNKIHYIISHLEDIIKNFNEFGRKLLLDIQSKLGWIEKKDENHLHTLLRIIVLTQLVVFDDQATINEAKHLFELHITKKSILPPDFRSVVYKAVLSVGNQKTYENMLTLYRETDMHEEKNRILSTLGTIKDINILQRILEFSMSEEVRPQDTLRAISSVVTTQKGSVLAWQYFKNNVETFIERFQSGTLLVRIVQTVTQNIMSEKILQDIMEFFEKTSVPGVERTIQQSIEIIKLNIAWLKRDQESIKDFFNQNKCNI